MSPVLIYTTVAAMALTVILFIIVYRTLSDSSETQSFENVLATITGGDLAEFDSTMLKTNKRNSGWSWQGWWLDATLKAGRTVTDEGAPGRFMLGALIISSLFGVFVYPGGIFGIYVGILVVAGARFWLSIENGKRKVVMERQMPMLLAGLRTEMASGVVVQQAIKNLAEDFPNPLGDELRRVRDDVEVGVPLSKSLESLAIRVDSRLMQFLVSSLGVGITSGADLVPQLVTLEEIVRMRARIDGKIAAAVALAKPTAYLAEGAPIAMFIWEAIKDPKYLPYFFGPGLLALLIGIVMYAAGVFSIQFMVKNVENI